MINYINTKLVKRSEEDKIIYIIGESEIGPIGEPIYVETIDQAVTIFGDRFYSKLTRSYIQYFNSGGIGAYLVKLNGTYSNLVLRGYHNGYVIDALELSYFSCGENGNSVKVTINPGLLIISYLENGIHKIKRFSLYEFTNIYELANEINIKLGNIINAFSLEDNCTTMSLRDNNSITSYLSGGLNELGLSKNQLYTKLESILENIVGKQMDIICIVNMYFDDTVPRYYDESMIYDGSYYNDDRDYLDINLEEGKATFHKLLIGFCKLQSQLGIMTHSIMGFNKIPEDLSTNINISNVIKMSTALKDYDGIRIQNGNLTNDHGGFLSLCYGDISYKIDPNNTIVENFYLSYAAIWINSEIKNSLTGISFNNIDSSFITELDNNTLKELTNLGIITYKYSPLRNWCTTTGRTLATETNPFLYSANIKIVQKVLKELYTDIDKYMNTKRSPIITGDFISKIVEESLGKRRDEDNIINSYNYIISYIKSNDIIEIQVELQTIYNIEKIYAKTEIQITRGV